MSSKLDDKVVLRVLREQRAKQLEALRKELNEAWAIWVDDVKQPAFSGYLRVGEDSHILTFRSPDEALAVARKEVKNNRFQIKQIDESVDVTTKVDGAEKKVIAPGLKLRSKGEGVLYTVHAVGRDSVVLRDPTGQTIHISDVELEKGYSLD